MQIRQAAESDWPEIWSLLEPVFRAGETYAVPRDIDEAAAKRKWIETPRATYFAADADGAALGTYYLAANHAGPGDHVCNCGYIVSVAARGKGIATALCDHSQKEAVAAGFTAMQFNLVVSTNTVAVRLWQKLGFEIIGTIPGGFRHPAHGPVDAYIMFKQLV